MAREQEQDSPPCPLALFPGAAVREAGAALGAVAPPNIAAASFPPSWKVTVMTTAGEQGQAAGLWQVAGQGRGCFHAGHKERSSPSTKGVKNVSIKVLPAAQSSPAHTSGLAVLAGSLLPSARSSVPSVPPILSEGTSPLLGSE